MFDVAMCAQRRRHYRDEHQRRRDNTICFIPVAVQHAIWISACSNKQYAPHQDRHKITAEPTKKSAKRLHRSALLVVLRQLG